jgi:hypothetical protein
MMSASPCWLLTDALGQTPLKGATWLRWGHGVTHAVWTNSIRGYHTDSVHLPYLMDPMFERYGRRARLWLSEVGDPHSEDAVRIASHSWTTVDEWERPLWVDSEFEARVRLRFALMAAAAAHSDPVVGARLRTVSLKDLVSASWQVEQICTDSRGAGRMSQTTSLAAMALRSVQAAPHTAAYMMDLVSRHYPVHAWYAAMAAACACVNLSDLADAAVRWEYRGAAAPVRIAEEILA